MKKQRGQLEEDKEADKGQYLLTDVLCLQQRLFGTNSYDTMGAVKHLRREGHGLVLSAAYVFAQWRGCDIAILCRSTRFDSHRAYSAERWFSQNSSLPL